VVNLLANHSRARQRGEGRGEMMEEGRDERRGGWWRKGRDEGGGESMEEEEN